MAYELSTLFVSQGRHHSESSAHACLSTVNGEIARTVDRTVQSSSPVTLRLGTALFADARDQLDPSRYAWPMGVVATAALAANLGVALLLYRHRSGDANCARCGSARATTPSATLRSAWPRWACSAPGQRGPIWRLRP